MAPQGSAGRIETHDIDEYQQVVPPWQVAVRQMSRGRFESRTEYVAVALYALVAYERSASAVA